LTLLKSDPVLKAQKVIIFSEYMATGRYLKKELESAGIKGVDEVDSGSKRDRGDIIRQFAPYYNESSSGDLHAEGLAETRVLISTDVLSEGLNLQDATRLINYDLHWNPVRLMQRIGRIDRRMNPDIEIRLLGDHPEQKAIRGTAAFWNFLPPDELDGLLRLYTIVSHKTLKISKILGIEGKKLLTPDDDFEALRDFVHEYEGDTSSAEAMHLEYQRLLKEHPDLADRVAALPGRVFSGKKHPHPEAKAVFFCYALPAPAVEDREKEGADATVWTEEAGIVRWYLYDFASKKIFEEPTEIIELIRCLPETPRQCILDKMDLSDVRKTIEKHIKNSYLKQVQAPVGVKPILKAWMEIS
jgi:superfamily II DNA/RNA helicase